jgi:hypothetical protein
MRSLALADMFCWTVKPIVMPTDIGPSPRPGASLARLNSQAGLLDCAIRRLKIRAGRTELLLAEIAD